jgi:hypothetical protein
MENGDKRQKDPEPNPILRDFALFGLIVSDLLGYTGAGIAIGWWLWKKQGFPIWVLVLTSSVGLTGAMLRIYQRSNR